MYDPADVDLNVTLLTGTEVQNQSVIASPGDAPLANTHNKIIPQSDRAQLLFQFVDDDGKPVDTSKALFYGSLYWNFNTEEENITGNHPDDLQMENISYNDNQEQWETELFTVECRSDAEQDRCYLQDLGIELGIEFDGVLRAKNREYSEGKSCWEYYVPETDTLYCDDTDYSVVKRFHELDPP
jgi:hypothetical protein